MSADIYGKKSEIAPHVLKQNQAIAQSKHCDRQNPSSLTETAIAPHVLKQNQVIASFSRER